ncbi:MAG: amidohydrolase family protein [Planctomycetales bacterium]|nr:amidohydrolase family protein [Planctomycetales bacterium]
MIKNDSTSRLEILFWLLPCFLIILSCPTVSAQQTSRTLIKAQTIYTVDGTILSPGQVLIQDGRIAFVGSSIELSLPAEEVEVDTLIPGIVNAFSHAGLTGVGAEISREVTPEFDTASTIDWQSRDFLEYLDQGVTTIQVLPETENVFAGFACILKSAGDIDQRLVNPQQGVVLSVSSDPTSRNRSRSRPDSIYVRQPTNRMGVVWIIRNTIHQTRLNLGNTDLSPQALAVLNGIVDGSRPVISVSRADFDIRSALELGETNGFLPTIYGGDEVYRMIDEFKNSKARLVYTALTTNSAGRSLRGPEGTELRWNVPGKLHTAEIQFCLAGENLLDQAQFAVRFGLPKDVALEAITLSPATILNIDKQLGSITAGKEADLVALSGDPLQPTSRVLWTMIGGKIYDTP